jgi:hypothetical protein
MLGGEIISLQSGLYQYELPPMPRDEREIINYDLPKVEQYWRTPVIKNVKHLSAKDRISYIEKERERWFNGVWIFINGVPTWITGLHYDHLTYMTFKSGKAEYFDHQRYDFYFRDLTRRDLKCRGRVFIKPRRYGMTMEEVSEATYTLMENFANNVGLQSDTNPKAMSTLMDPIISSYAKRPKFMRGDYYKPNGKLLTTRLWLKSNMAPDDDGEEDGDYIQGWARAFPALPRAMDGEEMAYIVDDEVWKWQESSPKETIESNMKVLMGRNRSGKISVLSTMGDSDDYLRSVMDGCYIIARSDPRVRDDNGYTLSGLFKWFVSAIYSFDIPPDVFEIDKFGMINVDKHLEYIHNKLNKLDKNTKEYIFEKRRLPLNEDDALLSAQLNTLFSKLRINHRLTILRALPTNRKPYVRGNLEETPDGTVYFEANPNGLWLWAVLPYSSIEKNINLSNRYRRGENGRIMPPRNPEGCIGYDPINYPKRLTSSDHLSRAAAIVHKKFDYFLPESDEHYVADVKMGLLLWRPDDPHEANKEVMKACKFTGFPCMHERSVAHVVEDFEDAKMEDFLLKDKKEIYGIAQSDDKEKKGGLALLQQRYSPPKNPGEKDHLEIYPFEEGLIDLDNFDFNNNTAFDVTMSEIYCEIGLKQIIYTNVSDDNVMSAIQAMQMVIPSRSH